MHNADMKTNIVHCKRDEYDVYIGRPSKFGNPFSVQTYGREKCLELFREYFLNRVKQDDTFKEAVLSLKDKTLGCFCKQPNREVACHGDIIKEWLDNYG